MINHPTTPPIAQISMVRRLIGIGGETTTFVRNKSIRPTMALTASPTSSAVVRATKTNTATTARTTTMSTTHSMENHCTQIACADGESAAVASIHQLPRRGLIGNSEGVLAFHTLSYYVSSS